LVTHSEDTKNTLTKLKEIVHPYSPKASKMIEECIQDPQKMK
jgi:hypothetical protein